MLDKLVSVIIPVYNVGKYVEEAIVSIQEQTYSNIEIIVIDDCSTDNTFDIVNNLAKQDHRIRLYRNSENLKIVKTLNRALSLANGEYIARMDGDDISCPDRIERKVNFLEKNVSFDLVGCSIKAIDIYGNVIGQTIYYSNQELLKKISKYVTPVSHIWVSKRSLYDSLGGYREIPGVEDYDFLLRVTASGFAYTNLEDYFGYYVRLGRAGNTINTFGLKQIKLHDYAYKLFEKSLENGSDDFSEDNLNAYIATNQCLDKLHVFSSKCLYRAIKSRGQCQYFKMIAYLLCSMISIYQMYYMIKRFKYRRIINKYRK